MKRGAVDSIALYESKNDVIEIQQSFLNTGVNKALDASNVVFDLNAFDKFRSSKSSTPGLITNDREKINGFYNQSWMMTIVLKNYIKLLEDHRK